MKFEGIKPEIAHNIHGINLRLDEIVSKAQMEKETNNNQKDSAVKDKKNDNTKTKAKI